MAKFIDGVRYDEDDYPIDPMGNRIGPRRVSKDPVPVAAEPTAPSGGGGGGGGQELNLAGLGGAQEPPEATIFQIGQPSQANPYLGRRSLPIMGLETAMKGAKNY
jgi:hypothetical protein